MATDDFLANFSETANIGSLLTGLVNNNSKPGTRVSVVPAEAPAPAATAELDGDVPWGGLPFSKALKSINWQNQAEFSANEGDDTTHQPLENPGAMAFAELSNKINWANAKKQSIPKGPTVTEKNKKRSVGKMLANFAW